MTRGAGARPGLVVTVSGARLAPGAGGLARWLAGAAPRAARGAVDIAIVSDRRMRTLNASFRHVDKTTDVLSFPAEEPGTNGLKPVRSIPRRAPERLSGAQGLQPLRPLGDIAIAAGVAARQAREHGHSLRTELRILALHGLLHLLGYDHERDHGEMRRAEERLRRRAGLPVGLIARTPGTMHP